jgi:hypothetical protein
LCCFFFPQEAMFMAFFLSLSALECYCCDCLLFWI